MKTSSIGIPIVTALALTVLMPRSGLSQTFYKCRTPTGITLSTTPCGEGAEKIRMRNPTPARPAAAAPRKAPPAPAPPTATATATAPAVPAEPVEIPDHLLEKYGEPAARYFHDGSLHLFYPEHCEGAGSSRTCAEVLVHGPGSYQVNHLPEAVMRRSVPAALSIQGWRPPAKQGAHSFDVSKTALVGEPERAVLSKLGEPDAKKLFMGNVIWEYYGISMGPGSEGTVTIFVELEDGKVKNAVGN